MACSIHWLHENQRKLPIQAIDYAQNDLMQNKLPFDFAHYNHHYVNNIRFTLWYTLTSMITQQTGNRYKHINQHHRQMCQIYSFTVMS